MRAALAMMLALPCLVAAKELRIELVRCEPSGMPAIISEKWNPKAFWIEQHVLIEMSLERRWEYDDIMADCRTEKDPIDRERCSSYYRNNREALVKCLRTTARMCRLHGGLC